MGLMSILMLLLSRGGGNDLLDYMPADAYWRIKGVTVTVERMVAELATAEPGDGAQAKAVRRLMALRALGELKEAEALPALRPLLESKDLFVADYARQAIAAIEGKPSVRPRPAEAALWKDLCLLPARCSIVGQARPPAGGPVAFDKLLKDAETVLPPMPDPGAALHEWAKVLVTVAERVGNVRLDGATVGVGEKPGDRTGSLVAIGRGLYDPEMLALIQPLDRSVPAWGAVRMNDAYRHMPALVPFDTLTLTLETASS